MVDGLAEEELGDVYELLGIRRSATDAQIVTAFRKQSLKCHPDRHPDDPAAAVKSDQWAEIIMVDGLAEEELGDVYELLGIRRSATDAQIVTAFRKQSLKCHPDRHPDDPAAAVKFNKLVRAKELLLDPARRAEIDNSCRYRKNDQDLEEALEKHETELATAEEQLQEAENHLEELRAVGHGAGQDDEVLRRSAIKDAFRAVQEQKKRLVKARYMRDKQLALLATSPVTKVEEAKKEPPEIWDHWDGLLGSGLIQGLCELAMPVWGLFSSSETGVACGASAAGVAAGSPPTPASAC
eukprot:CAMPEP_0178419782 /NCGR_PEP_ID=MMETSP0689_2-20121128/25789_1 /TAXON_ID=160604 /ORGANISM="Amphidinium massartii, Strain CS-259" /LENGTH=295 /DNA_ID=CAMNT_0020041233 /DNA_START=51 /DNA_END=939 /DNA_ORIENTATION=-